MPVQTAGPDRELLGHDFETAREIVRARRAANPRGAFHVLTQQGAHILNKITEVDQILGEKPSRQDWLIEVHPEVSFRELARERADEDSRGLTRICHARSPVLESTATRAST